MIKLHRLIVNWWLISVLFLGFSISPLIQGKGLAWKPKKPVEFVIMAGKGGGADRMSRLMQTVIEKHKFSAKPFIPINKPGGSGAESLIYLKQHTGDNHVIMVTLNSFYTTPLRQPKLGVDISKFTPIELARPLSFSSSLKSP